MAMRGAALVERVARCGSAGLRPAAPAASATRIDAVFIIALDLCVRRVVCGLLSGSVLFNFALRWRRRVVRFCSLVMLSVSLRGLLQQLLLRIDLVAYTAYETSCDCIQDAGADPQALFTCRVCETLVCLTVANRSLSLIVVP